MTQNTKYLVLGLFRWDDCKLDMFSLGAFFGRIDGMGNGSIGFIPVFDDLDKLKAAYPGYAYMKVEIGASE